MILNKRRVTPLTRLSAWLQKNPLIACLLILTLKHCDMGTTTNSDQPPPSKPILPWKTRLAVSLLSTVTDSCRRQNGTINRRLLSILDFKAAPNPHPINSVFTSDFTVNPDRHLWFRLFTPTTVSGPTPVIMFFHGGGFTFLSAASKAYDAVCRRLARKFPAFVVSVNYRLSPEHPYPCQYDDGCDVLKFLDEARDEILPQNADLSKVFLAGDSAGANIAHNVAVRTCQAQFRVIKVIGLISIQPFFGGEERTESETRLVSSHLVSEARTNWIWKTFLPDGSTRDHPAANVSGPNAVNISGLDYPETLVIVGGFDPLQDWQRRYHEWLRKSGKEATLIEYPSMIHAFYVFPELPEATHVITQIKDFIANRLSKL